MDSHQAKRGRNADGTRTERGRNANDGRTQKERVRVKNDIFTVSSKDILKIEDINIIFILTKV